MAYERTTGAIDIGSGFETLPNSAADKTTTDTWLFHLVLCNKTAGAVTVTVKDRQATPKTFLNTVSIAASTTYIVESRRGILFQEGINWVASAADSIDAELCAVRRA